MDPTRSVSVALRCGGSKTAVNSALGAKAGDGKAMAQLKDRRYAEKYRAPDVDVHLIGVDSAARRATWWRSSTPRLDVADGAGGGSER